MCALWPVGGNGSTLCVISKHTYLTKMIPMKNKETDAHICCEHLRRQMMGLTDQSVIILVKMLGNRKP